MPLQIAGGARVLLKTGLGFTVTVTSCPGLLQPLEVSVKLYVTTTEFTVVLVKVSLMFPLLEAADWEIPATAARLQLKEVEAVRLEGM